ncbi:MAG: lysophospholipid acyltransferase family protein [Candidatus Omnitrophica bacterium]|nr:lysophospholipid acyltransferase family protein [Candidatus Omnitrophota bacterium]MBU1134461.1 lysophospholipid acyltransferase family protein [Candidatus Omnitrophota bacterium]MBU1810549.1 lysophospholipid acyltransferase family protein [Candidatus Omnitrophota bacterium]
MQAAELTRKIAVKKRGNALGFWFFKVSLRLFGLKGAYGLLYFVCLHYLFFDRLAVSAALAYVNKRFRKGGFLKRRLHVYRLFINQGKQLLDRYAAITGAKVFDIQLKGYEKLKALLGDSKQGIILLTAHVGNWQVAMTTLKELNRTVYLLMRPEDNPAVQSSLNISPEQSHIKIISPEQYLGGTLEVMKALGEGNIVSIMGDRRYGFDALGISFLENKAYFPFGAFSIAASSKCPIIILLSAKLSWCRYIVDVSHVLYPRYEGQGIKREQLRKYVQEFAGILDKYVQEYPYQCFLFHDVWNKRGHHT